MRWEHEQRPIHTIPPANLLLSHQLPTQNAATAFQNIQPAGHQCNCLLSFLGILCNFSTENLWFCAHIWEKISIFGLFWRPPFINQQAINSWRPYILAAGTPLRSSLMMPSTVHRCGNQEKKNCSPLPVCCDGGGYGGYNWLCRMQATDNNEAGHLHFLMEYSPAKRAAEWRKITILLANV